MVDTVEEEKKALRRKLDLLDSKPDDQIDVAKAKPIILSEIKVAETAMKKAHQIYQKSGNSATFMNAMEYYNYTLDVSEVLKKTTLKVMDCKSLDSLANLQEKKVNKTHTGMQL